MFRNSLTFKFGKTIGLLYLFCIAAGIFSIAIEKIYYLLKHVEMPDYGLSFVIIILLNVFVILAANFFIVEIILFIIDCCRIKKIINCNKKAELNIFQQYFDYLLFLISILVPIAYMCAILPNIIR